MTSKVYVGNLGSEPLQESDLEEEFQDFGHIKEIFVARNPPGFAYIGKWTVVFKLYFLQTSSPKGQLKMLCVNCKTDARSVVGSEWRWNSRTGLVKSVIEREALAQKHTESMAQERRHRSWEKSRGRALGRQ